MTQRGKIGLSVAALGTSCLSAAASWGFMGAADHPQWLRLLCGFCFNATPVLVVILVIAFLRNHN